MNTNYNNNINQMNDNILKVFSSKQVSFLADVNKSIQINKYGEFKYFNIFRINSTDIQNFLLNLDNQKVYTVIPIMSINKSVDDPFVTLSKQILVTRYSNPKIITQFLVNKINRTDELFGCLFNSLFCL
jgi:hypothetical protein